MASWVSKCGTDHTRVYVSINEHDLVLVASDIVNPDRMGNSRRDLNAARVGYMDFTDGEKAPGWLYDPSLNAYRLIE